MTHHKETNGKLLSDEEVKALERLFNAWDVYQRPADNATVIKYIPALLADREARKEREARYIEFIKRVAMRTTFHYTITSEERKKHLLNEREELMNGAREILSLISK